LNRLRNRFDAPHYAALGAASISYGLDVVKILA
jgi:hypothetical protein